MPSYRRLFYAILLIPVMLFTGCLDIDVLVKVRPDGSGSIIETVMLQDGLISMAESLAGSSGKTTGKSMIGDREQLKKNAVKYGAGVVFKEATEKKKDDKIGYTAVYTFSNIENVLLNVNPDEKLPEQVTKATGNVQYKKIEQPMKFLFTKGTTSTLTILNPLDTTDFSYPETDNPIVNSASDPTFNEEFVEKLANMFGFTIRFAVEPEGKIVQTNATTRHNKQVTLLKIDFAEIMKHRKVYGKLKEANVKSFSELKNMASSLKGFEMPFEEKIIIQFK